MSSSLSFARIIDPVCSCGTYVGKLQPGIEFKLIEVSNKGAIDTDDTDLATMLTDMDIKKICCRRTIIISPVLRLVKHEPEFNNRLNKDIISKRIQRLNVKNPDGLLRINE